MGAIQSTTATIHAEHATARREWLGPWQLNRARWEWTRAYYNPGIGVAFARMSYPCTCARCVPLIAPRPLVADR